MLGQEKYVIYCYPEPMKKIYLKDIGTNDSLKTKILNCYLRKVDNNESYNINFDIVFTEDVRKAELFVSRDIALKCVDVLSSIIPEDFKLEKVADIK